MSCEYYHSSPHLPGCPNAPAPKKIYKCHACKDGIVEGEEFYRLGDYEYHVECVDLMSSKEILDELEIYPQTAEEVNY